MKPIYIIKIGGSVATYKDRSGVALRRSLLANTAKVLAELRSKKNFNLILVHGAGSVGHRLAHKFGLKNGAGNDPEKISGALKLRIENQKFNASFLEIMLSEGLPVSSVHTASVIAQEGGEISYCDTEIIKTALEKDIIPVLYGEMAYDNDITLSVCSGDVIAPYLAKELGAKKVFFASDIDGIFDKDPYHNEDAELMEQIDLSKIEENVSLSGSHSVDVTGGLGGKIRSIRMLQGTSLDSIEIFNGLKADNYRKIILGEKFPHTKIFL